MGAFANPEPNYFADRVLITPASAKCRNFSLSRSLRIYVLYAFFWRRPDSCSGQKTNRFEAHKPRESIFRIPDVIGDPYHLLYKGSWRFTSRLRYYSNPKPICLADRVPFTITSAKCVNLYSWIGQFWLSGFVKSSSLNFCSNIIARRRHNGS